LSGKKNNKKSQLSEGGGHFWFLHGLTLLCFLFGYLVKGVEFALMLAGFIYLMPIFISFRFNMKLSKSDLSKFYKINAKK